MNGKDHADKIMPYDMEEYTRMAAEIDTAQSASTRRAARAEIEPEAYVPTPERLNSDGEGDSMDSLQRDQGLITPTRTARRSPSGELSLMLRALEIAINDSKGLGPDNDWVATLDARDWIRAITWEQLQELAPDAAPTAGSFNEWKDGLEAGWVELDAGPTGNPKVEKYEAPGKCLELEDVFAYLLEVTHHLISSGKQASKVAAEASLLMSLLETKEDLERAVPLLLDLVVQSAEKTKHVGNRTEAYADKLVRLQAIVERRGMS